MKYITKVFIDPAELDKWLGTFDGVKVIGYSVSDGKIFVTIYGQIE